ncbi:hypothetical protein HMPREF0080_01348 [Anaeroglobus geminatus F0357]|uniref:Uncharacterized protein n=1 Tax=Anaeroglobus geminatus F0357 TaxID=861450 RepID=G9YI63_9FIRM|nr:hypothetical protein HMPREF0080_01348 [Anaeroglobus geminatus F0357]
MIGMQDTSQFAPVGQFLQFFLIYTDNFINIRRRRQESREFLMHCPDNTCIRLILPQRIESRQGMQDVTE